MPKVQQIFDDSQQGFGAEKIKTIALQSGIHVSTNEFRVSCKNWICVAFAPKQKTNIKNDNNIKSKTCWQENLLPTSLIKYGSVTLHVSKSTTTGFICAAFSISTPARSLGMGISQCQYQLGPHDISECILGTWQPRNLTFHRDRGSNIYRVRLRNYFSRMDSSIHFLQPIILMTTPQQKLSLVRSKKKRRTEERTPQSKAFEKAWSNIFSFTMRFDRTKP